MEFTRLRRRFGHWGREPLLHFVLLAILVFVADAALSGGGDGKAISLSEAPVEEFVRGFEQRRGRAPDEAEIQHFRENWLKEEVLYREGLELGLERNDPVVRGRVISKMQLLLAENMPEPTPTDAELKRYLRRNADSYRRPDRYSFDLIRPRGADADKLLAALNQGRSPAELDAAPRRLRGRNEAAVVATLGEAFLSALKAAEPGERWQLLPSNQGQAVARLVAHDPGTMPALADIRSRVAADWRKHQRVQHVNNELAAMQSEYRILE